MDKYTVSKVKSFEGREGLGHNATLLRNGTPVADVMDDASGGPTRFRWIDAGTRVTFPALNYKDEPVELTGTPEEGAFWAYCIALGQINVHGQMIWNSPDVVVENLVNEAEAVKRTTARLKRSMKDRVLFIKDGAEFFCKPTKKGVDPMTLVDGVKQRHPTATILNLLPIEEAVALALALEAKS